MSEYEQRQLQMIKYAEIMEQKLIEKYKLTEEESNYVLYNSGEGGNSTISQRMQKVLSERNNAEEMD